MLSYESSRAKPTLHDELFVKGFNRTSSEEIIYFLVPPQQPPQPPDPVAVPVVAVPVPDPPVPVGLGSVLGGAIDVDAITLLSSYILVPVCQTEFDWLA